MRVSTSGGATEPGLVTWLGADPEASRAAHLERRRLELRDIVQSSPEAAPLARWEEPPAPDSVPRWAWQQVKLVARLKQMADWWIDFRQIDTGEFGNGPEADAALARLLPVVAMLDGRVDRYRQATRRLFDQLARDGHGPASKVAIWPALELDPGSAWLAEAAMGMPRPMRAAPAAVVKNVEQAQGDMWRRLEERFEWLTTGEPRMVEFDAGDLETIRLGAGRRVSWENTGGDLAAVVDEARADGVRMRLFAMSRADRRIRLRARGLEHGEYDLALGNEPVRRVTLKPGAFVELDLAARRVVPVALTLRERNTPLAAMPDLAVDAREISSDLRGLAVPVHNIGGAAAGRFRVTVRSAEGEVMAEAAFGGLEAPVDGRPRILLARIGEVASAPGMRVEVRLESGEEAHDSNNDAVLLK